MPIAFLGKNFDTQDSLIEYVQKVRDRYPDRRRIGDADEMLVRALFEANPEHGLKLGTRTVSHFEVRKYLFKTRAFFVVFTDGSSIDFSFMKSIRSLFERTPKAA